ncbi:MAG: DNA-binding protein [Lachnospiraceae bacterium]|nr:DNA-binding protein [Lachnospiraceae bacterium]
MAAVDSRGMERVKCRDAAAELGMSADMLHLMMQRNMSPIGYAVRKDNCKNYHYIIYRGLLDTYKRQIAGAKND